MQLSGAKGPEYESYSVVNSDAILNEPITPNSKHQRNSVEQAQKVNQINNSSLMEYEKLTEFVTNKLVHTLNPQLDRLRV